MNERTMQQIIAFGERYRRELLADVSKEYLETDWYRGVSLFLACSFYQGRRDEVSERVAWGAMSVLEGRFKNTDFTALTHCDFEALTSDLSTVIGRGKVGKARDVQMIVGILKFVAQLPEENFTRYSVAEIRKGNVRKLYEDLMGIMQIGPKIASFYLRDLVDIYDLESALRAVDLGFLQPIDVWVRRVALKTGIIADEKLSETTIRERIVGACRAHEVSAFRFNQGAWYLGKHAFEILIDHLDELHLPEDQPTALPVQVKG